MEPKPHGISILAVEDDKATRKFLQLLISRKFPNISLHTAENGIRGLELFNAYSPEIVITDIIMPEMDGAEMSDKIRRINSDTKLIVITGYSSGSYHEQFGKIRVNAFLTKPLVMEDLCAAIRKCVDEMPDRQESEQ